jgi:molecular chaperone GrpE
VRPVNQNPESHEDPAVAEAMHTVPDRSAPSAGRGGGGPLNEPGRPEGTPGAGEEGAAASGDGDTAGTTDEIAELEDRWRRAMADLDNLRKRFARELDRELSAERARVTSAWLPVLDNLELALGHADADPGSVVQGVRAIRDQAVEVLGRLGYPRRDQVGVPFDPNQHEVVALVDQPDVPPGTVVNVVRPGYGEEDRQLRPTAVAVSRNESPE